MTVKNYLRHRGIAKIGGKSSGSGVMKGVGLAVLGMVVLQAIWPLYDDDGDMLQQNTVWKVKHNLSDGSLHTIGFIYLHPSGKYFATDGSGYQSKLYRSRVAAASAAKNHYERTITRAR